MRTVPSRRAVPEGGEAQGPLRDHAYRRAGPGRGAGRPSALCERSSLADQDAIPDPSRASTDLCRRVTGRLVSGRPAEMSVMC